MQLMSFLLPTENKWDYVGIDVFLEKHILNCVHIHPQLDIPGAPFTDIE